MENEPQLVICPNCTKNKPNAFLGSLNVDGYFIVRRGHFRENRNATYKASNQIMIAAEDYSIVCECGYYIHVKSGRIVTDAYKSMING